MQALVGLIRRLERAKKPDRYLDSEITAAALGPSGCIIDPVKDLDGWDILLSPDRTGEAGYWREAADIGGVTAFLDAACELVAEARPDQAASIMARAFRRLPEPAARYSGADYVGRAARAVVAELLREMAGEQETVLQAA